MENKTVEYIVEYHSNVFKKVVNFVLDSPSFYSAMMEKLYTQPNYQFSYTEYCQALLYLNNAVKLADSLFRLLDEQKKFNQKG